MKKNRTEEYKKTISKFIDEHKDGNIGIFIIDTKTDEVVFGGDGISPGELHCGLSQALIEDFCKGLNREIKPIEKFNLLMQMCSSTGEAAKNAMGITMDEVLDDMNNNVKELNSLIYK